MKPAQKSVPAKSRSARWQLALIIAGGVAVLIGAVVTAFILVKSTGAAGFLKDVQTLDMEAAKTKVRTDIKLLTQASIAYKTQHQGEWPATLLVLTQKDEIGHGPYVSTDLRDPWGREYVFDLAGVRNNGLNPDISCVLPDGQGTISNWSKMITK